MPDHWAIQDVRLKLHQQIVAYHSPVHSQHRKPDAGILLHGIEHVARLKRRGFKERCAGDVALVYKSRQPGSLSSR